MNIAEALAMSPLGAAKSAVNINAIRHALTSEQFFWTLEFVPSVDKVLRDELNKIDDLLASIKDHPLIAGFSATDRVHSDRDPDPVTAASQIAMRSGKQPLVH